MTGAGHLTIILVKEMAVLSIITVPEITAQVTRAGSATVRHASTMVGAPRVNWPRRFPDNSPSRLARAAPGKQATEIAG